MQKVIGLDIGSYSIKAVEIVNTFKSYEITNFYENVIPEVEEVSLDVVVPAAMEQLFNENNLQADRIITAMPGQFISSRVMSFNFQDARKIETAVMSEIEDYVPFNMDDMIVDHQLLGAIGGKSMALAVMTRKEFLRNFLDLLQRIKIDPKLVDVDSLAFYNLSSYMEVEPGQCYGLVDVGHEKTSVCIVRDGVLRMFRSINLGGRYISEFLARDLEVDYNEAQRIKHRVSRMICEKDSGSDLSGDDRFVVERMTLAANAIVKELGRTLYAFKTWEKAPVGRIFLSGGTSRIRNFANFLEDQLEAPVVENRLDRTQLKINPKLSDAMAVMPQSVAIGMRAISSIKRHSQINLRKGEFAYVQDYESLLRGGTFILKAVGIALLLLVISFGAKSFFYHRQINALHAQYIKELTSTFPDMKKQAARAGSFTSILSDAKNRFHREIDTKRTAIDDFVKQNSGSGALDALRAVSEKMPKDVKVDITLYQFTEGDTGTGRVVLGGETDAYASVSSIIEALKTSPVLKEVEEKSSGAKPGTNGSVIEFRIHANYAAPQTNAVGA